MRAVSFAAALALVLAGCAQEASPQEAPAEPGKDLKATETTGVIRGVVVDAAVVPIEGVEVSLTDGPSTTTDADGFFGFADLAPGNYFLQAKKAGWSTVQASAEVVAGVDKPNVVRIQLEKDASSLPRATPLLFEGIIVCSVSIILVGFAACSAAGMDDVFLEEYSQEELGGAPGFVQSEMLWDSTQAAGDRMTLVYSAPGDGALLDNYGDTTGTSPIMVNANQTTLDHYEVPGGRDLMIRVFNAPIEGTDIGESFGDPRDGDNCIERPVLSGCTTGLGVTLDQTFSVYTHAFFGFEPPEDWRFSTDGDPVPPS